MNMTVDGKYMESMITDHGDDLCHYGVPKMKWYQRLYQRLDGTLTPLGRLHYGIGFKNIGQVEAARRAKAKAEKEKQAAETERAERQRQDTVEKAIRSGSAEELYRIRESMTDQELSRAVQRMNATRQLESALKPVENKPIPKDVEAPKKLSFFDRQAEKKRLAEEAKAAEAKKEREAKETLDKGLEFLDTATKITNSVVGAYQSYNKVASIINATSGDKLPTFDLNPWNKPNGGKIDKKSDGEKLPSDTSGKPIGKDDWKKTGTYDGRKDQPKIKFGNNTSWSTSSSVSSGDSIISALSGDTVPSNSSTFTFDDLYSLLDLDPDDVHVLKHADDDYICHYCVIGQRWGIRKYQNENGSLTDLGRKHYAKIRSKYNLDRDPHLLSDDERKKQLKKAAKEYRRHGAMLNDLKNVKVNTIRKMVNDYEGMMIESVKQPAITVASALLGSRYGYLGSALGSSSANYILDKWFDTGITQRHISENLVAGTQVLKQVQSNKQLYNSAFSMLSARDQKTINIGLAELKKRGL